MTVERIPSSPKRLRTTQCALCGARRGDDYIHFSRHVAREHSASDLQGPGGES